MISGDCSKELFNSDLDMLYLTTDELVRARHVSVLVRRPGIEGTMRLIARKSHGD